MTGQVRIGEKTSRRRWTGVRPSYYGKVRIVHATADDFR